jgi:hypothetical protein
MDIHRLKTIFVCLLETEKADAFTEYTDRSTASSIRQRGVKVHMSNLCV